MLSARIIYAESKEAGMWRMEHSVETAVSRDAIWLAWAEVKRWPEWDAGVTRAELSGPFAAGSTITMTPRGQDPVQLRLSEVVGGVRFVDEATLGGTVVRVSHSLERLDAARTRVVHRLESTGPLAEQIGSAVSADFAETLQALVEHAARLDSAARA